MLALYVNDGLIASSSKEEAERFIKRLQSEFKIKFKLAEYFLGLEIHQNKEGIKVTQTAYTRKLLKRFRMTDSKAVNTSIIKNKISEPRKVNTLQYSKIVFPYREAVGSLMYIMTETTPDIAYAVGVISRTLHNPTEDDIIKIKRIF